FICLACVRLTTCEASARVFESAQVVMNRRTFQRVRAVYAFHNLQRAAVQRLGAIELASVLTKHGQIVQRAAMGWVAGTVSMLRSLERLHQQPLRGRILTELAHRVPGKA